MNLIVNKNVCFAAQKFIFEQFIKVQTKIQSLKLHNFYFSKINCARFCHKNFRIHIVRATAIDRRSCSYSYIEQWPVLLTYYNCK